MNLLRLITINISLCVVQTIIHPCSKFYIDSFTLSGVIKYSEIVRFVIIALLLDFARFTIVFTINRSICSVPVYNLSIIKVHRIRLCRFRRSAQQHNINLNEKKI